MAEQIILFYTDLSATRAQLNGPVGKHPDFWLRTYGHLSVDVKWDTGTIVTGCFSL